jgi:hypothetical protein
MNEDRFDRLLAFLARLDRAKIHYTLANYREGAVSVEVHLPGEHWEVDFLADGDVDVERYRSNGKIEDASVLEELFVNDSDAELTNRGTAGNHDDATARK